jgi:cellulose synthase/poly-beta-1,6-N-acetylglucosamine synthase-like glycosyltransferase
LYGRVLDAGVVTTAVAHALAVVLVLVSHRRSAPPRAVARWFVPLAVVVPATVVGWWVGGAGSVLAAAVVGVPCAVTGVVGAVRWVRLRASGATMWVTFLWCSGLGVLWMFRFLSGLAVSPLTRGLLLLPLVVGVLVVPTVLLQVWLSWGVLIRRTWRRPGAHLPAVRAWAGGLAPMVSVHVPAHAEPPDVVMSTLDTLARLDYPNFEVLVVDNNTADPALWEPVRDHCERLGPRFRFLHVEGLTGAKAGALNWVLPQAHPDAALIAVVDADYHVEPWFLAAMVGHFDDPTMGWVQSPHDYRDWRHSAYQTACYWEYAMFTYTTMVALDEHDAGLNVGTMYVMRRQALADAGGWSEWCLSEDTELAIRIHAAGYRSMYLTETMGRGLVPGTFAAYRKQRFRWTYGGVQEIREHWRMLLTTGRLGVLQRICHSNHGLSRALPVFNLALLPLSLLALASIIWHGEHLPVPAPLWIASLVLTVTSLAQRWCIYTRVLGASAREALSGIVGGFAVGHVISLASLAAMLGRPAVWTRTAKFRASRQVRSALRVVAQEIVLGAVMLVAAVVAGVLMPQAGARVLLVSGLLGQAFGFLCAPAMVLRSERELTTEAPEPAAAPRSPATVR